MRTAYVLLLCLVIPLCARAQECSADDQTVAEEQVQLTDFVALLSVEIPENCGNFSPVRLVPCRNEIDVIEGCCMSECQEVFEEFSSDCLQSLAAVMCMDERNAPAVAILDRMAARCDDDYKPITCEEEPTEEEAEEEDNTEGGPTEAPTEEDNTEEAPTEEAPTEEAPTEEAPTEEAPTEEDITDPSHESILEEEEADAPGSLPEIDVIELEFDDSEG